MSSKRTIIVAIEGIQNTTPVMYVLTTLLTEIAGLRVEIKDDTNGEEVCDILYTANTPNERRAALTIRGHPLWDGKYLTSAGIPVSPPQTLRCEDLRELIGERELPVLFAGGQRGIDLFVHKRNETIVTNADIVASAFFFLSRYEEVVRLHSDRHDRFPGEESFASRNSLCHRPLVDEYGAILVHWLHLTGNRIPHRMQQYKLFVSHDVDHIIKYKRAASGGRELISLLGHRAFSDCFALTKQKLTAHYDKRQDPYWSGLKWMMHQEKRLGITSQWFFLAQHRSDTDYSYSIDDPVAKKLIKEMQEEGHEIGLHVSYYGSRSSSILKAEAERFCMHVSGSFGARCHFLRAKIPQTLAGMDACGIEFDSSLGFADRIGFRCGTSKEFHPYDIFANRRMRLIERPLIVMDTTLQTKEYECLKRECAFDRVKQLIDKCRFFKGRFVLLWHNSSLERSDRSMRGWDAVYQSILEEAK